MRYQVFGALLVASSVAVGAAQQAPAVAPTVAEGTPLTLTGCVVKGDGGHILSGGGQKYTVELVSTTPNNARANAAAMATAVNTPTARGPQIFYWLENDDAIKEYVGQIVELQGKITGDIAPGEIEVEIEEGMVELEFKSEGRKVTVKVPSAAANVAAAGTSGMVKSAPVGTTATSVDRPAGTSAVTIDAKRATGTVPVDRPVDMPFMVRKVNVVSVKTLSKSCL